MTAMTMPKRPVKMPSLIIMLAAFAILFAWGNVIYHSHATNKHGKDAEQVRECLNKNGPYMVLKHKFDPTYYLICQIDKGTFGFQAVDESGHEKTAFIREEDTSLKALLNYLKDAVRFKGTLPWLP